MGISKQLREELVRGPMIRGVQDGVDEVRRESKDMKYIDIKPNYEGLKNTPVGIGYLRPGVLGVTPIDDKGNAHAVVISRYIADMVANHAEKFRKGWDWAKQMVYKITKDVTEHEMYHVASSKLARGEKITKKARDIMESITTYGRAKMARMLGKYAKARRIEETNPYPNAWELGKLADWAEYQSSRGRTGYAGFLGDAQEEPFYKPLWRLSKAAAKAVARKGWKHFKKFRGYEPASQAA